ncbi:MAG: hypothetical protein H7Z14_20430 [Anaerolineae bacterium]|nr:hypothetical protein [Phycisphaerae bacterium]
MFSILLSLLVSFAQADTNASRYFAVQVVDEQTGRGVPLVQLETVDNVRFVTDSNGLVAIDDPAMMNQKVFFKLTSHGYEFKKDMFDYPGEALEVKAGARATLKIKRINIAERLYRITGEGIYRDSVLLGDKVPIKHPLLNAQVVGQDSAQVTIYQGKVFWIWGDTSRMAYPLGNFMSTGATSLLPGKGGLDPSAGIDLEYFGDGQGFTKKMAPVVESGLIWLDGLLTLPDESGRERLLCHFSHHKDLATRLERGLLMYNDEKKEFERLMSIPVEWPLAPSGFSQPGRWKDGGIEYIYFNNPYPNVRVRADLKSLKDLSSWEAFTPLATGARFDGKSTKLEKSDGKIVWGWKRDTQPLNSKQQKELIDAGLMKLEDSPQFLRDADTNKPILMHGGSCHWNEHRKAYVMIGLEGEGTSFLGEVWYAEAPQPTGPWKLAKKVVTHNKYSFYNPVHHPFFDQENGKLIYFEGTYATTFSGTEIATPRYEYNQIMYRLDLSDPRLKSVQENR